MGVSARASERSPEVCTIHYYQLVISKDAVRMIKDGQHRGSAPIRHDRTSIEGRTLRTLVNMLRANRLRQEEEVLLGEYLYSVLLANKSDYQGMTFGELLDKARYDDNVFLRVELVFEGKDNELADMPWEYLYRPESNGPGYFLATDDRIALVRRPQADNIRGLSLAGEKELRVLLIASSPNNLRELEFGSLVEKIGQLPGLILKTLVTRYVKQASMAIETGIRAQATYDEFLAALDNFEPHVVHILGHGKCEEDPGGGVVSGQIAFVDEGFQADFRKGPELVKAFKRQPSVRLAFLQACETAAKGDSAVAYRALSSVATDLVQTGIPAIVAMQTKIENAAANSFATAFFRALLEQRQPIFRAMQMARSESHEAGCIPVLYLGLDERGENAQGVLIPAGDSPHSAGFAGANPTVAAQDRAPDVRCPWCTKVYPSEYTGKKCVECGNYLQCPTCGWRIQVQIEPGRDFIFCGDDSRPTHKIKRYTEPSLQEAFVMEPKPLAAEYGSRRRKDQLDPFEG